MTGTCAATCRFRQRKRRAHAQIGRQINVVESGRDRNLVRAKDHASFHSKGCASVTVPAGSTRATFGMKTRMVLCPNQVTISARFNDVNLTADLGVGSPFSLPKAACGGTGSRHRMHSSRCVLPGCADLPWLAAPLPAFS